MYVLQSVILTRHRPCRGSKQSQLQTFGHSRDMNKKALQTNDSPFSIPGRLHQKSRTAGAVAE
jgi:hypothetical protein